LAEIYDLIESYRDNKTVHAKETIIQNFILAGQIGNVVAYVLDPKNVKAPPEYYQAFPELFKEEAVIIEDKKQRKQLELYKAQMTDYALSHNNNFNGQ
jgi:hypothetical protein